MSARIAGGTCGGSAFQSGSLVRTAASVSDAVMLMDLRNTNALMFKNSASGALNMVYRRGDGTIGWVEPSAK